MDKYKWNLENIRIGLESFFVKFGRYPTSQELDAYEFLPSSRQIQRRFGGLVQLRKLLKLNCPEDFTKGDYSSQRAKSIGIRAHQSEQEVYDFLVDKFGSAFVHREYFFTDDRRTRTDFYVHCKEGNFSVDVFFPKNRANLINCLNSKMKTYGDELMLQYPVIFLMMNPKINEEAMDSVIENKKKKLHEYQQLMCLKEFKKFCARKKAYEIA